jgi:penicillin-binding protein 1B
MQARAKNRWIVSAGILVFLAAASLGSLAVRLHVLRAQRATGPGWSFPARVYSDGVPLLTGRTLPEPYLLAELAARDYRPASSTLQPGTYARLNDGYEIGLRGLPDEPPPLGGSGPERVRVHLANGHLVALERLGGFVGAAMPVDTSRTPMLEPMLISLLLDRDRVWRTWVSLARVPQGVQDAILSSEDRRFYGHIGIDFRGTARALLTNMRSGEIREGGSTITQQLVRSLFLGRERTFLRKVTEIPLAIAVDLLLRKQDILEMYLNSVYWGQAQGFAVGGIGEASRWYFDAPVESLGVLEGATLAAMIPAPNVFDPFDKPERTRERRNAVLQEMVETHRLSAAEAAALSAHPLEVRHGPLPVERFPSYTGYVTSLLDRRLSREAATHDGLLVVTPMDLAWQIAAEEGVSSGLEALGGGGRSPLEGAFVALEPATSSVVAMVGGRAVRPGEFNRAFQAQRQTGSAIKPIVYAAALTSPLGITPATTLPDTTRTFGQGRWAWTPQNYDHSTHPKVTLAKALEASLNIATANLVDLIGAGDVARTAERFGLGRLKAVPSIGLGTNETTLLRLTNAFAVFRERGMLRIPSAVRWVSDRTGKQVMTADPRGSTVLPEGVAALMTGLLQNVVRYGVAVPLRSTYGFDRPVAGKTGTTDDYHDAWFVGFTPDVVAGVWVGYDMPRNIGRQAAHTAIPVWARVMNRMLDGFPKTPFETDTEVQWTNVDPWSGFLADSLCPSEAMPFLPGTGPVATCTSGQMQPWEYQNSESLYTADSSWTAPEGAAPTQPARDSLRRVNEPSQPVRSAPPDTSVPDTSGTRPP